jgi:ABC-type transport system substrate-binding protein
MEERIQTAKNLLAEAGYSEGFHSEIWYPSGGSAEFNREMGTIIQAQLAQVGITVDLKMIESAVYSQYRSEGRLPMFFRGWTLDYVDPDSEVFYCMYSTSTYLTIPLGFNNSHVDELIRQGRVLYDPTQESEERRAVYEELQDYIVDEGFCVPLYISGYYDVKQAWVEGYKYWNTCDTPYEGVWAASKVIPDDWATHDPPM